MVNNNLVGGLKNILKNDGLRQWEGWRPIYEMDNKTCLKPSTRLKTARETPGLNHVHQVWTLASAGSQKNTWDILRINKGLAKMDLQHLQTV